MTFQEYGLNQEKNFCNRPNKEEIALQGDDPDDIYAVAKKILSSRKADVACVFISRMSGEKIAVVKSLDDIYTLQAQTQEPASFGILDAQHNFKEFAVFEEQRKNRFMIIKE